MRQMERHFRVLRRGGPLKLEERPALVSVGCDVGDARAFRELRLEHDACDLASPGPSDGVCDVMGDGRTDQIGKLRADIVAIGIAQKFVDILRDERNHPLLVQDDHCSVRLDAARNMDGFPIAIAQIDFGPIITQWRTSCFLGWECLSAIASGDQQLLMKSYTIGY